MARRPSGFNCLFEFGQSVLHTRLAPYSLTYGQLHPSWQLGVAATKLASVPIDECFSPDDSSFLL